MVSEGSVHRHGETAQIMVASSVAGAVHIIVDQEAESESKREQERERERDRERERERGTMSWV